MFFRLDRNSVHSIFCDFSSSFWVNEKDLLSVFNLKWPDDFEDGKDIGTPRFQVIRDFRSGLFIYNHEGNLCPYTKKKLLERSNKIKTDIIIEKLGRNLPYNPDNVYFSETGFDFGNVEFMTFDVSKRETSFRNRKVLNTFPLFWLLRRVVEIKEMVYKKNLKDKDIEKLEKEKILNHNELKEWKFKERGTVPSMYDDSEIVECALQDYNFSSRDDYLHVWLKCELFHT